VTEDIEVTAARMEAFLKDEVVVEAFKALEQNAYRNFLTATDNDQRVMAQAQAKVLDTLQAALRAVVDAGERTRTDRERRERAPVARD
jgi:hypothetical protein